jgi:hypothetical protein
MAPVNATATATRPLCFAIGPYGVDDSHTRKWSNFLFDKIIEPVLKDGYTVQRTIDDPEPGQIFSRIQRDLNDARVVVADLTDANPNVYFELGFRQALNRPLVHMARAGTVLPFDLRDFEVIWVHADYFEPRGFFVIADDKLDEARNALRAHVRKAEETPLPAMKKEPVSAKVYQWQMWYSSSIAVDWLDKQKESFRNEVASYETGGGTDAIGEGSLTLFAEYLALKGAASLCGDGTIFLTWNNHTGKLDFGHAVFKFANAPEAVLINVVDVKCSDAGVASIRFVQHSRPFPIERAGRMINVTIPGYNYTLTVESDPGSSTTAIGTIAHPHSRTAIGQAELTPRYGDFLR